MKTARVGWHLALVLAVLLLSVGCSGVGVAFVPTPEPIALRFAYRRGMVDYKPLLDAFHEKNPLITVEAVEMASFDSSIADAVRDGRVDLFRDDRRALEDAKAGLLKPVGELVAGEWDAVRDDYFKGSWEALSLQGRLWGIPAGVDPLVTFVNRDQLGALKLATPPQDWELADFLDLANKMSYPEGLPYDGSAKLFGCCTTPGSIDPIIFVYLHGGKIVDSLTNPSEPTLDDPRTVEAVKWYVDLFTTYAVAPDPAMVRTQFTRGGLVEAQVRGLCGVWLGQYSGRGGPDTRYKWAAGWRMRPLPKDRAPFEVADLDGYFVTKSCTHPEAALKLVRFLSEHWEAAGQRLPPRRSLIEQDAYLKAVGEEASAVARGLSDQVMILPYAPDDAPLSRVAMIFLGTIYRIIAEDLDPGKALGQAQDESLMAFQQP